MIEAVKIITLESTIGDKDFHFSVRHGFEIRFVNLFTFRTEDSDFVQHMASVNLKTPHKIIMLSRVILVCLLFSSNNLFHFTVDRDSCSLPQIILLAVLALPNNPEGLLAVYCGTCTFLCEEIHAFCVYE